MQAGSIWECLLLVRAELVRSTKGFLESTGAVQAGSIQECLLLVRAELARSAELRLMLSRAGAAAVVQVGLAVDRPCSPDWICQARTCCLLHGSHCLFLQSHGSAVVWVFTGHWVDLSSYVQLQRSGGQRGSLHSL